MRIGFFGPFRLIILLPILRDIANWVFGPFRLIILLPILRDIANWVFWSIFHLYRYIPRYLDIANWVGVDYLYNIGELGD